MPLFVKSNYELVCDWLLVVFIDKYFNLPFYILKHKNYFPLWTPLTNFLYDFYHIYIYIKASTKCEIKWAVTFFPQLIFIIFWANNGLAKSSNIDNSYRHEFFIPMSLVIAWCWRSLATFPENPGSVLSTDMVANNHCNFSSRGSDALLWLPQAPSAHVVHRHTRKQVHINLQKKIEGLSLLT